MKYLNSKLKNLVPYVPGEQPADMDRLMKLNTNECPFPPSPKVIEAVNAEAVSRLRLYSDPTCRKLVEAIAAFEDVKPENIFAGNGSDEILSFVFHGFCENGAAFADITYGLYPVLCQMFGVAGTVVPLKDGFSLDPADYADLSETVVIANPNAPTGMALPLDGIRKLMKPGRLTVVDEAYVDFGADSAVELLKEYDNLLVVKTFSKSRSLAGGRIGYAVGSKELIADLNMLKYSFNPYNINSLSIIAGVEAVKDVEYFEECRAKIIQNREMLTAGLRELGFTVLDSKANFVFAKPSGMSGKECFDALRENGILVRRFDKPRINDFLRITVGDEAQTAKFLETMRKIVRKG
ncbi:MAG TPA: histidinol-phosphate transaminase [Oscillospiraceae bacterium]|nr:histidinol-phosphate transaminase [Oscillospiraceae bacterium]HPF56374.1 histidinol-phosphate transaminase [Clostridiales bacterium]HPK35446.1 histidinol-phosphate transaminase [Oscillospiraceae bacterium]HPR75170.1 histidinol-phosphate transaminase [Oscillospiraceae bacterium]